MPESPTQTLVLRADMYYGTRRGISRAEALRRIVRKGLDSRGRKRAERKAPVEALVSKSQRWKAPDGFRDLYRELTPKVGTHEARRIVLEEAARASRKQATA